MFLHRILVISSVHLSAENAISKGFRGSKIQFFSGAASLNAPQTHPAAISRRRHFVPSPNFKITAQPPPPPRHKVLATGLNTTNVMKSFREIFEIKTSQMESKLQTFIDNKFGQKMKVLTTFSERMEERNETSDIRNTEGMNYSKAVGRPTDFRKIMQETRNEEIVEEKEKQKRSKHFIIHGLAEIGEQNEEIKENDANTIKRFLDRVGITRESESITRLGKPNEGKKYWNNKGKGKGKGWVSQTKLKRGL